MLIIRLTRVGKKKDASFRVVVVDSKRKVKAGNYLEMLGSYDPRVDKVELNAERIKHWMHNGAQTSDTVHNLLVSQKIIDGKKINILPAFKAAPAEAEASSGAVVTSTESEEDASASAETPVENTVADETPADTITE